MLRFCRAPSLSDELHEAAARVVTVTPFVDRVANCRQALNLGYREGAAVSSR